MVAVKATPTVRAVMPTNMQLFGTFSPQLEQSCEVLWALTGTTNKPAFSALFVSIDRKLDHPASNTDLAIWYEQAL
jgi:hypothetical protein